MPEDTRQPIRVLVVDDEAAVRAAYGQILSVGTPSADRAALADMRARLFSRPGEAAPAAAITTPHAVQFQVEFCVNAEEAVQACRSARERNEPFAVAFLDMRMPPGPDGVWAAEQIRALDHEVEIVVCTAFSDVDPAAISQRVPPADKLFYLQKPFHPHEVRQLAVALGQKWCAERRITKLAYFDGLTGLPNRTLFQERITAAIESAAASGQQLAVLYFDLDNFKRINDTLGHGVGDELLRVMAERLSGVFRRDDVVSRPTAPEASSTSVARLGGDEFVALVKNVGSRDEVSAIAERMLQTLRQPLQLAVHQVLVTPSVGVAIYPADGADVETLFRNADLAMYFAKRQGAARVAFFNETMSAGGLKRLTLESKLREALQRNEFSLKYQPQFELDTGLISGFEALLRWTSPDLGPVAPADFIPVAEETGLILPIGEWVLRTACRQKKAWHDAGLINTRISVNVSARQFAQPDFAGLVSAALRDSGLPAQCLEIEVTESMVMHDENRARQAFEQLKAIGVSVAIDDFGTGYSSLNRLREFAVDRLKIDRAFISDMHRNTDDRALVTAMIRMAQTLGLAVVAEGVEDFLQLRELQDERCDTAQGILLSQPLSAAEAEALLEKLTASQDASRTRRLASLMQTPRVVNLE